MRRVDAAEYERYQAAWKRLRTWPQVAYGGLVVSPLLFAAGRVLLHDQATAMWGPGIAVVVSIWAVW